MSQQQPLYVIGAGGHAKVVIDTARACGYTVLGCVDDNPALHDTTVLGAPVLGSIDSLNPSDVPTVIAIGSNRARFAIAERCATWTWGTLVHPSAVVSSTATLGVGTVLFAGVVIQADTVIGAHCILNTACSVDHDCVLGDYVHIAPGSRLAGDVAIGTGSFFGIGSAAIPGTRVGDWTTVGAGAAVVRNLPSGVTAVGVPARVLG